MGQAPPSDRRDGRLGANPASMRLFHLSIAYLTLLFAAIAVVSLLPLGPLVEAAAWQAPMRAPVTSRDRGPTPTPSCAPCKPAQEREAAEGGALPILGSPSGSGR
jgi:hypothetical protein